MYHHFKTHPGSITEISLGSFADLNIGQGRRTFNYIPFMNRYRHTHHVKKVVN